jgi:hypothetical protein
MHSVVTPTCESTDMARCYPFLRAAEPRSFLARSNLEQTRRLRCRGSRISATFALAMPKRARHFANSIVASAPLFVLAIAGFAPVGVAAAPAEASPEESACAGKAAGDACTMVNGAAGTCGDSTCNRLDYSGGSPPKATEEPCVACVPGTGATADPGAEVEDTTDPADSDPPVITPAADPESTAGDPPETNGRCAIAPRHDADAALLVGLLALVLGARRRAPSP